MSDFLEFTCFGFITFAAYWLARRMKLKFSGENYTPTKSTLATLYNFPIVFIHMRFAYTENLPFYGHMDNSVSGLISFIMAFLHLGALPSETSSSITQLKTKKNKKKFLFWRR